jgi:predicted nucleotidyltransferase
MKTIKEIKEQIERLRRVDSEVAQRDLMILEYILEEIIEVRPEEAEVILKELIKVLAED